MIYRAKQIFISVWMNIWEFCIAPLTSFPKDVHKKACINGIFSLLISFSPLISVFIFYQKSPEPLYGELYVYISSFLAPVLYIFLQRLIDHHFIKRNPLSIYTFQMFKGGWAVFAFSIILLLFSAIGYGAYKANGVTPGWADSNILLYLFLFLSIYLWYIALADSEMKGIDYTDAFRKGEDDFNKAALQRTGNS